MKHPKPEPVVVSTLCSLCGEDWEDHGDDPTTLDCIRLLRARPFVSPYTWPSYPQVTYTSGTSWGANTSSTNVVYMTPRSDDGPDPIGAAA